MNDAVESLMQNKNDAEILAEIVNTGSDNETVLKTTRNLLGYDGFIEKNKYEDGEVYVAFESNQFKNVDNKKPTADPDIRHSVDIDEDLMAILEEEYSDTEKEMGSIIEDGKAVEYLTDILTSDEYNRVKHWISNRQKPSFISRKGEKVLRLDNKLVYTDFKADDFGISKIVIVNTEDSYCNNVILDSYTDYERGKIDDTEQLRQIIENIFGKGVFREYTTGSFNETKRFDRPTKRGKSYSDDYHAKREQNRKRVFVKDEKYIKDDSKYRLVIVSYSMPSVSKKLLVAYSVGNRYK